VGPGWRRWGAVVILAGLRAGSIAPNIGLAIHNIPIHWRYYLQTVNDEVNELFIP
jgi:hypothetical protein